ncbi:MAG: hypothetical protein IPM60_15705 [Rhodospirillales bacterium]|nr:hypothetical protein [Rhodospirillales bacterium]
MKLPRRDSIPTDVARVLRCKGVDRRCYLAHDGSNIYTSSGTIEDWHGAPRWAAINVHPTVGRNATGHRLPASSWEIDL